MNQTMIKYLGAVRVKRCIWMTVTLVTLSLASAAFGAEESRLSREPIPLQTEAYALFAVADIADFNALVSRLRAESGNPDTPAGRVWALLSPRLRADLEKLPEDEPIARNMTYRIITELNSVIRRRDLYVGEVWQDVELPEELRTELAAGLMELPPIEATYRNRQLLRLTFPGLIKESQTTPFPDRPAPITIFGDPFLNRGELQTGFRIPTGAVWQPSLFAFGTFRSAWQYIETGDRPPPIELRFGPPIQRDELVVEEWANRLDVFFNLELTATERLVLSLRPLDEDGDFSGYEWQRPDLESRRGFHVDGDAHIEQLYFEGDFGELFPNLDREDRRDYDFGFAVGRQPVFIQEGILLNDNIDAIGITRNNIQTPWTSNLQITGMWAWDNLHRGVGPGINRREDNAEMFGLFTTWDTHRHTFNLDLAYTLQGEDFDYLGNLDVRPRGGDQLNVGFSAVQRIGKINTSFRYNASWRTDSDDDSVSAADGQIFLAEASYTPAYSEDLLYGTFFWANDNFQSAARDPVAGGPLARTGILFEAPGIGRFMAPIENTANESVGGAVGYQWFFNHGRGQLIGEIGGRIDTDGQNLGRIGGMLRFQHAFSNRYVWRVDAFHVEREQTQDRVGIRTEFQVRF